MTMENDKDDSTSISVNANDVLCGRGGMTNNHEGNKRFRELVAQHQGEYLGARKKQKMEIANRIVDLIADRGGRFLTRQQGGGNVWIPVPPKKAQTKTSQALREGLDVRHKTIRPEKMPRRYRFEGDENGSDEGSTGENPSKRAKVFDGRVVLASPEEMPSHPYLLAPQGGISEGDEAHADAECDGSVPELTHDSMPALFGLPPAFVSPITDFEMLSQTPV